MRRYVYQCRGHHIQVTDEVPDKCLVRINGHHLPCWAAITNVYELVETRS